MSCSGCKYLKKDDEIDGSCGGCKYYCSKTKTYVCGDNDGCSSYEKDYGRSSYECNRIYEDGESYSDVKDPGFYFVILILLIIFLLTVKLFNLGQFINY